jgi:hypothetical protein
MHIFCKNEIDFFEYCHTKNMGPVHENDIELYNLEEFLKVYKATDILFTPRSVDNPHYRVCYQLYQERSNIIMPNSSNTDTTNPMANLFSDPKAINLNIL